MSSIIKRRRSGGVIGTIGPIGGSGVFSLQERHALSVDNFDDVSLYLKMNGANGSTTFYDSSLYGHTVTANGNAQISTAQSKFGGASAAFDGTGDYLDFPASDAFAFGTGDFTVEFFLRATTVPDAVVFDTRSALSSSDGFVVSRIGTGLILFTGNASRITVSSAAPLNSWVHVALVRSAGTTKLYVDGNASVGSYSDSNNYSNTGLRIAERLPLTGAPFGGYIDDLRITKGVARYTANFTPPQREFRP